MRQNKVLISAQNLKQYFPVKRGKVCKANDGISVDIYEGETFGVVGESGCGKSTFGRTLLQLNRQTSGRTIYYGQRLDAIAPKYVDDTLKKFAKERKKYALLLRKQTELRELLEKAKDDKEKFSRQSELDMLDADVKSKMHELADVVGGFLAVEDSEEAVRLMREEYALCNCLHKRAESEKVLNAKKADLEYDLESAKSNGWNTSLYEEKLKKLRKKERKMQTEAEQLSKDLNLVREKLESLRAEHMKDEAFLQLETCRDGGIDLARLRYREMRLLRSDLQMVFQDPYSSLNPRMSVGQIIDMGMKTHHLYIKENERLQEGVLDIMQKCGLQPYFLHRFPHQFSGGQRQRIGIARSLAVNPKFVVCDEAVSALDVSIQSQIINLLQDLKQQSNLTYLFITHDLSVVKYISDRIGVMYLGSMVELAPAQDIFDNPAHPYTRALIAAIPTVDSGKKEISVLRGDIPSPVNPPKGCKFHTRCDYCTEICKEVAPKWEEISPNHYAACHNMCHLANAAQTDA